jgi:hypothetical protein
MLQYANERCSAAARLETEGLNGFKACFVTDNGYVRNETITGDGLISLEVEDVRFIRAEIRNGTDSMIALTNPIYLV